jgi:hypothetical protein
MGGIAIFETVLDSTRFYFFEVSLVIIEDPDVDVLGRAIARVYHRPGRKPRLLAAPSREARRSDRPPSFLRSPAAPPESRRYQAQEESDAKNQRNQNDQLRLDFPEEQANRLHLSVLKENDQCQTEQREEYDELDFHEFHPLASAVVARLETCHSSQFVARHMCGGFSFVTAKEGVDFFGVQGSAQSAARSRSQTSREYR